MSIKPKPAGIQLITMFQQAIKDKPASIDQVAEIGRQYYRFASQERLYRQSFDIAGMMTDLSALENRKTSEQLEKSIQTVREFQAQQQRFVNI